MPTTDPAAPATTPAIAPTPGRVVWFVLPDGTNKGEVRPAIIIKSWGGTCVQLAVLRDGSNDRVLEAYKPLELPDLAGVNDPEGRAAFTHLFAALEAVRRDLHGLQHFVEWRTSVNHDQDEKQPGTWHWMPFQLGQAAKADGDVAQLRAEVERLTAVVAALEAPQASPATRAAPASPVVH